MLFRRFALGSYDRLRNGWVVCGTHPKLEPSRGRASQNAIFIVDHLDDEDRPRRVHHLRDMLEDGGGDLRAVGCN